MRSAAPRAMPAAAADVSTKAARRQRVCWMICPMPMLLWTDMVACGRMRRLQELQRACHDGCSVVGRRLSSVHYLVYAWVWNAVRVYA